MIFRQSYERIANKLLKVYSFEKKNSGGWEEKRGECIRISAAMRLRLLDTVEFPSLPMRWHWNTQPIRWTMDCIVALRRLSELVHKYIHTISTLLFFSKCIKSCTRFTQLKKSDFYAARRRFATSSLFTYLYLYFSIELFFFLFTFGWDRNYIDIII